MNQDLERIEAAVAEVNGKLDLLLGIFGAAPRTGERTHAELKEIASRFVAEALAARGDQKTRREKHLTP